MLRIIQSSNASQAKSYYSTSDYYMEGQELTGLWRGEGARRLGLEGKIDKADWDALCDNRNPMTGGNLTARTRGDRTTGYDFNFHAPKSVSLLYALSRDERILEAFRDSVEATMLDIEAEMQTRVRKDGKNENRVTGNAAWGEFIHFTSRPVDGVPDPHLHAHCYCFNVTHDDKEQKWKAGQFRELKRDSGYFEALFHSRLAYRLASDGLPIERTRLGWELAGVDRSLVRKFSRRTQQIENKAREMGIDDPDLKSELGAKTRSRKQKNLSMPQLEDIWRQRLSADEEFSLRSLQEKVGGPARPLDRSAAAHGLEYAIRHEFERKSVVPERALLATALKHSAGYATAAEVLRRAEKAELIVGERNGRRMVTTRDVLNEERRLAQFARDGRGTCQPFVAKYGQFSRDWLNDDQKRAVRHIVESRDRVILVRGAAGVGKTTLLQEAAEAIERSGTKVCAFAPSAAASRGVLNAAGFKDADTVARLLVDAKLQQRARGNLLWIDEAGLLGAKTTSDVFTLAEKLRCRVLLTGDRRQHGAVERGAVLRMLEEEAGLVSADVKINMRQRGAYREAVNALSEGQLSKGFRRLDDLGWIKEVAKEDRYQLMAADYVETVMNGKQALVISPTHREGERITTAIREALRDKGRLGAAQQRIPILESANLTEAERGDPTYYSPGDVLVYHQNTKGHTRGQRVEIEFGQALPTDQAKRFQVFRRSAIVLSPGDKLRITRNGYTADGKHRLTNGAVYELRKFDRQGNLVLKNGWTIDRQWGFLDYGYAVTSHASQGRTIDGRVLIGQSGESFPASSKEQFYVSCSRAKDGVTIYTDCKKSLHEAISQSDERLTASELIKGIPLHPAILAQQRDAERGIEQARHQERERIYER